MYDNVVKLIVSIQIFCDFYVNDLCDKYLRKTIFNTFRSANFCIYNDKKFRKRIGLLFFTGVYSMFQKSTQCMQK